ncbi:hypothetical protein PIB30_065651, partial [Stylosanthes scabra]|nr:hypothetical protein [Stylosanthes scabra]
MDVFYKYDTRNMNPIPAILADTFLSIDVCNQKKGGGRLRCCSHMLYVWFMTYAYAGNCMGFVPNPLKISITYQCGAKRLWHGKKRSRTSNQANFHG